MFYPYTSSNTETTTSQALAVPYDTLNTSAADPVFCKTSLFPAMTSSEDPAGIVASFTICTSFEPALLSKNTLAVIPAVDVFDTVIPITIDSNALEPAPAGTLYTEVAEAPEDVFTLFTANLLKSLAIFYSFLLFILS